MDYNFDQKGFLCSLRFAVLTGVAIFSDFSAGREFSVYFFDFSPQISNELFRANAAALAENTY